ncbi:MAG TPA: hypothetical protein VLS45_02035, partial [Methylomicrobium sp.]|nr:hypothetical protein [Methylomicrobium sp.]
PIAGHPIAGHPIAGHPIAGQRLRPFLFARRQASFCSRKQCNMSNKSVRFRLQVTESCVQIGLETTELLPNEHCAELGVIKIVLLYIIIIENLILSYCNFSRSRASEYSQRVFLLLNVVDQSVMCCCGLFCVQTIAFFKCSVVLTI